jgi:glycosyltransferase involved in cell wall biosynthesis
MNTPTVMAGKVLHVLSQRPSLTGSGITLDSMVDIAREAGWDQHAVVGSPASNPAPNVGGLPHGSISPLLFDSSPLNFPIPGMSDVMPYPSTRFSSMPEARLKVYADSWRRHLGGVIDHFKPDIIHSHHIWLLSSIIKDVAPDTPVITHCHATGLRQMTLCPHLADRVTQGCSRNEQFAVLHGEHAEKLSEVLHLPTRRIHLVGAGYDERVFHAECRSGPENRNIIYAGKFSHAKGLPWLLDAMKNLTQKHSDLTLHVAGSGAGAQSEDLRERMISMSPTVVLHGQLTQIALADLMRRCKICVLPSFHEGLPLALVEAFACGCRIVSTRLPGVEDGLAPSLGAALDLVSIPRLEDADIPLDRDIPAFVEELTDTLDMALNAPAVDTASAAFSRSLAPFTWRAVFERVEKIWKTAIG